MTNARGWNATACTSWIAATSWFSLFNAIVKQESSYVCRLRDNSVYEVVEDRPLMDADRAVNVLSDQIVHIGLSGKAADRPDHPVRSRAEHYWARGIC